VSTGERLGAQAGIGEADCSRGGAVNPRILRKSQIFLVNASQVFEKGDPKNFISPEGITRIADTLLGWKEEEKLSRIVAHAELKKNDYNISPSRYIHTSDAETYRPIAEIVDELNVIEAEARETDKALRNVLKKIGL
jgi:type I restriction enzyme M protein